MTVLHAECYLLSVPLKVPKDVEELAEASGAPVESCGVAVNCTICPTVALAAAGVTATVATGTWATVTTPLSDVPALLLATTLYLPT